MNAPDAIALPDRVQDGGAANDTAKDRVDPVQVRLRRMGDEVLAASRIGSRESHADGSDGVADRVDFVPNREARSAPTIAAWIAVLDHEIRNDAVPACAVEITPRDQIEENRDRQGCLGRQQLDVQRSAVRLQRDVWIRAPPPPGGGPAGPGARGAPAFGALAAGGA